MYVNYVPRWLGAVAIIVGAAAAIVGCALISHKPVRAAGFICGWILFGIGIMAYTTAMLLWLALHMEALFPQLNPATLKEVASVVTGAVTTFLGVIVTKDMEGGTGFFWPGTLFKKRIQSVFGTPRNSPAGDTKEWDAVFADRVRGDGPRGWGCQACVARAKILDDYLKSHPPP